MGGLKLLQTKMKEGQDARGARVKTPTRVRSAVAATGEGLESAGQPAHTCRTI